MQVLKLESKTKELKKKLLDDYTEFLKSEFTSTNTIKTYNIVIDRFLQDYKGNFTYLSRKDVTDYKDNLELGYTDSNNKVHKSLKASSFNQKMTVLKHFNQFLIDNNVQKDMVIIKKDFRRIQKKAENPNNLEKEQVDNILEIIKNHDPVIGLRDATIIACMAYGGLRIEECLTLRIGNVDLITLNIAVMKGKENKDRDVDITASLEKWLKPYLDILENKNKNDYLFVSQKRKGKIGKTYINKFLKESWLTCQIEDYPELHPHAFRHFCGYYLLNTGVYTITDVQEMLGHESITTTQLYTQSSKKSRKNKAKLV